MARSRVIADHYLDLIQEALINSIYRDRATVPWSHPVFDAHKRERGLDQPQQAFTMIGRARVKTTARVPRACLARANRR